MSFKHELGQVVTVTISEEEGHIKARAEYTHGPNQYLIHYHLRVLPEGEATTGRRTRGKRLVFIFHSHHHHVHRLLIFQMSDFQ
ncbi:hypothetical protein [Klebsiella quasipneumoniae]|uniref:hypothetical protein n=1 Tax=Klebsiella quasipneumoniae TaxID=1463165 RepID=UPI0038D00507